MQQSSQDVGLSWQSFDVAAGQTVDFVQPSATAIAVNRILGNSGSVILGRINANGQVYLINPDGIVFGRGGEPRVLMRGAGRAHAAPAAAATAAQAFFG